MRVSINQPGMLRSNLRRMCGGKIRVGSNVEYAGLHVPHQFGATSKSLKVSPRPFVAHREAKA